MLTTLAERLLCTFYGEEKGRAVMSSPLVHASGDVYTQNDMRLHTDGKEEIESFIIYCDPLPCAANAFDKGHIRSAFVASNDKGEIIWQPGKDVRCWRVSGRGAGSLRHGHITKISTKFNKSVPAIFVMVVIRIFREKTPRLGDDGIPTAKRDGIYENMGKCYIDGIKDEGMEVFTNPTFQLPWNPFSALEAPQTRFKPFGSSCNSRGYTVPFWHARKGVWCGHCVHKAMFRTG